MSKAEMLRRLASALERREYAEATTCLGSDFAYYGTGHLEQPLTRSQFLELLQTIQRLFPTLRIHLQEIQEEEQRATARMQLHGLRRINPALSEIALLVLREKAPDVLEEVLDCRFEQDRLVGLGITASSQGESRRRDGLSPAETGASREQAPLMSG